MPSEASLADVLPRTAAVIQDGLQRQLHTGCQLYLSRNGSVVFDAGIGESHPGQRMDENTINLWLSAGKPLTAAVVLQMWEQRLLDLDEPVAKIIPEFAKGGKDRVSVRHLLTHTAGIRTVETGWPDVSWEETIRRICASDLEPNWVVGRTAGYHTATSWFVLGEILIRLTGTTYPQVMTNQLFHPLELVDTRSEISPADHAKFGHRIGRIFARERGELLPLDWHGIARCQQPSPGSNLRGPIRDLGRFYEMLLNRGLAGGRQLLLPQTVDDMTARHRTGQFDQTLAHTVDFGLGVIIDSNLYGAETVPYGYGRYCSPRTFGHGGAQSSHGWCDPEAGLVVAWYFNGRPGEGQHSRRTRQMNEAIYLDLGLASP